MKKVWIVRHVGNEGAGTIRDFLDGQRISYEMVDLFDGGELPALTDVGALVVMGGPMNVDEELLATHTDVPHQAYRWGKSCYALQFHVEVNRGMLEDWFVKRPDKNIILAEFEAYRDELHRITTSIYKAFFINSD